MDALFARIVDDAALFPPARTPMRAALPAYRAAAGHPMLGRFLCPASRLAELRRSLIPEDLLDLVLVADTGIEHLPAALETVRKEPRVRLRAVEIALDPDADQARAAAVTIARLPLAVPHLFVEVGQVPGWREALDRLASARGNGTRLGATLRTGGRADADGEYGPAPAKVAAFVTACAERDLPFTCTAGPHRAVRHVDPATGLAHHGFLNILVATGRAHAGQGTEAAAEAVASTDATALVKEAAGLDRAAVRGLFTSFGSCDTGTPRADLIELWSTGEDTRA